MPSNTVLPQKERPAYLPDPADDTRAANTVMDHFTAAMHHGQRSSTARAAGNGQAAARHWATALCHTAAKLILEGSSPDDTLTKLVGHISTLHVQTRYARRHDMRTEVIADRERATRHYQILRTALRKAGKGIGGVPSIVHYPAVVPAA